MSDSLNVFRISQQQPLYVTNDIYVYMETKICGHCKKELSVSCFYKNRSKKSGLSSWCKTCHKNFLVKSRPKRYKEYEDKLDVILKTCSVCNIEFTLRNFHKQVGGKYGRKGMCKSCSSKWSREYKMLLRLKVLNKISGNDIKCIKCSFDDIRALQIEHVNSGGNKCKGNKAYTNYLKGILKLPMNELNKKFQILCANCNWIKVYENGERYK